MDQRGLFTRLYRTDLQAFVSRKFASFCWEGGLKVQHMQIQSLVLHQDRKCKISEIQSEKLYPSYCCCSLGYYNQTRLFWNI